MESLSDKKEVYISYLSLRVIASINILKIFRIMHYISLHPLF